MEEASAKPPASPCPNPLLSFSTFVHRVGTHLTSRLDETRRRAVAAFPAFSNPAPTLSLPFASVSERHGRHAAEEAENSINSGHIARSLVGTSVYTVSTTNNEFVLMSDPDGVKSIGLLCFRKEDAEAFLAQVRLRRGLRGGAKVVPINLDQVYLLKVEGIAFRFLPDPVQIKNALELRASQISGGFDGVPVFQSDLLVVKKKNKRYCPIYFQKEDLEKALSTGSRSSPGPGIFPPIMVGSLEDVLKKMEISDKLRVGRLDFHSAREEPFSAYSRSFQCVRFRTRSLHVMRVQMGSIPGLVLCSGFCFSSRFYKLIRQILAPLPPLTLHAYKFLASLSTFFHMVYPFPDEENGWMGGK